MKGHVYLLHFERRYWHAQHYLGWTGLETVEERLARHLAGQGSPLVAAVVAAGIGVELVRTWTGGPRDEARFKRWQHNSWLCPVCNPNAYARRTRASVATRRS